MERVVVGIDGSEGSKAALHWAYEEAELHHVPLQVVVAVPPVSHYGAGATSAHAARDGAARFVVSALPASAQPAIAFVEDLPEHALVEASDAGTVVVVGARGLEGFERLLLGSVSHEVVSGARGPVAVVRSEVPAGGDVVVGIDGSRFSADALTFAASEARARGVRLTVVHAYRLPVWLASPWITTPDVGVLESLEEEARRVLQTAVGHLGDTEVRAMVGHGSAAGALLAVKGAALLVVGSHSHGGARRLRLGSVARQVLHQADVPVLVVPPKD